MNNYYSDSHAGFFGSPAYFLIVFLLTVVGYVIVSFFLSVLFKKMGIEGWKAWVPVYSNWTFLEAAGIPGWYALFALAGIIPIIGFIGSLVTAVFTVIAAYKIGRGFQKGGEWAVLYFFLPLIWIIILAYNSAPFNRSLALSGGYGNPYQAPGRQTPPYYSTGNPRTPPVAPQSGYAAPVSNPGPTDPSHNPNPAESSTEPPRV